MKSILLPSIVISLAAAAAGQQPAQGPPGTDIFIASLTKTAGKVIVGSPTNLTKRAGYDNQPSFVPDGSAILFSSARDGKPTDIYRRDVATGAERQLTDTPDGEYSPTVTPDGKFFSVIRQAGQDQHLWKFPLAGGQASAVIDKVNPIGYHVWADDKTLVLFVLGKPATLQVVDVSSQKAQTLAQSPGRSLHRIPGTGPARISFVHKVGEKEWIVKALDPRSKAIATMINTLPGSEDVAWTPDGILLSGQGSKLFAWDPASKGIEWREIADFGPSIRQMTRIAVSPKGDRIAFVAADVP